MSVKGLSHPPITTDILTNPKKVIHIWVWKTSFVRSRTPTVISSGPIYGISYPHISVYKMGGLYILNSMDILNDFKVKIDCDTTHCSVRYYLSGGTLATGILRVSYNRTNMSPNVIVVITSMNIDKMIEYIVTNDKTISPITTPNVIRQHCTDKVREHLSNMGGI